MRARIGRAAILLAFVPAVAGAQSISLTESQAIAQLGADSPRVRVIRAAVDIARADVLAAARWPNPRVTFDRESVAGVTENMTMVAQVLPVTGRRRFEIRAADAMAQATSSRAEDQLRRARADLRLAYADLVSAQVREDTLARAGERLRELADVLERREAAGEAAGFDRLRAEREVLDLEADRSAAAADRVRARAVLASFFTQPAANIVAAPEAPAPTPVPPLEALLARAEEARGDLVALRREAESARLAEQAAGRRAVPEPEVVAGTKSSTAAGGDVGSVFSVHATVPLFDRGHPERAAARARAGQADARADALRLTIGAQIGAWRTAVVERRDAADRYRASAAESAERVERIAQVSYEAGERGILELLDAYRSGAMARVRQAALDAAVREAEIELEFVSGWEMR